MPFLSAPAHLAAALCLVSILCAAPADAASKDAFNPYTAADTPNAHKTTSEGVEMLKSMGGGGHSIIDESHHRPAWQTEVYPILFGNSASKHEMLVLLDFSRPESRPVWSAVSEAVKSLSAKDVRVVLFCLSAELYAKDLAGMAIWAVKNRPGQAMEYVSWVLRRWDEIKRAQSQKGKSKPFMGQYDAVASETEIPLAFQAMERFRPSVADGEQMQVSGYIYEAGNINFFQAREAAAYYGTSFPSIVIDGKPAKAISPQALIEALR